MPELRIAVAHPKAAEPAKPAGVAQKKLEEAAEQFESLLIGQMLKSVRESLKEGALGGEQSEAGQSMIDFASENLASVAGKRGLGLKPLLVQGFLAREMAKAEAGGKGNAEAANPQTGAPAQRGPAGLLPAAVPPIPQRHFTLPLVVEVK